MIGILGADLDDPRAEYIGVYIEPVIGTENQKIYGSVRVTIELLTDGVAAGWIKLTHDSSEVLAWMYHR